MVSIEYIVPWVVNLYQSWSPADRSEEDMAPIVNANAWAGESLGSSGTGASVTVKYITSMVPIWLSRLSNASRYHS